MFVDDCDAAGCSMVEAFGDLDVAGYGLVMGLVDDGVTVSGTLQILLEHWSLLFL